MHEILSVPGLLAAAVPNIKGFELSATRFGWFDAVVLLVLGLGVWRGRQRGMSSELLDLLLWVMIVVAGGLAHVSVGGIVMQITGFSLLASYITAYVVMAVLIKIFFILIKHGAGEKLVGSDVFGNMEYYLGMCSGLIRFFCALLVVMAVLNARYYTPEELRAQIKYQEKELGKVYFPTLAMLQKNVFVESMTGQTVKEYLSMFLITPTSTGPSKEGLGRRRERDVNEALGIK